MLLRLLARLGNVLLVAGSAVVVIVVVAVPDASASSDAIVLIWEMGNFYVIAS